MEYGRLPKPKKTTATTPESHRIGVADTYEQPHQKSEDKMLWQAYAFELASEIRPP
jgi:hypothetical protein